MPPRRVAPRPPGTRRPPPLGSRVTPVFIAVRGRARLRVRGLRHTAELAQRLERRLGGHVAVLDVRASPLTGNVLVRFDPGRLTVDDLLREVFRACDPAPSPRHGRPRRAPGEPDPGTAWHSLSAADAGRRLRAPLATGLSAAEAAARRAIAGPNRVPPPPGRSPLVTLRDQVATLPVLLLAGAAVLSLASGGVVEATVILGVVAINTGIGYVTERRVEGILATLRDQPDPATLVRREGRELVIPAGELVPGDVVHLRAGDDVPADARLLEADGLAIDESALTGESMAVPKVAGAIHRPGQLLAERSNMVHAGTVVAQGSALALVTATGRRTEMGRIRTLVGEAVTPPTPMERQLDRLGQGLVGVSLACCGAALGLGLLRGVPLAEMAAAAIALAVAAVPEGLPAVATTTLALGTQRMARRGALIRRLAAVEGLGAATVICVDKTGTITANRMTVRGWQLGTGDFVPLPPRSRPSDSPPGPVLSDPRLERAVTIGVLCNEAELVRNGRRRGWSIDGSGTEGALLAAGHGAGLDYRALRARYPILELRPRAEGENWMATVHAVGDDRRLVAVKGAPEEVLGRAVVRLDAAGPAPLDAEARRAILEANARMANDGMRVLGLAYREVDGGAAPGYDDLVWVGLVGLADPIRPGVREAIAACRRAGIRIVMLTGDQALTALTVARELGLVRDGQLRVAEAGQLEAADAEGLRRMAREVDVYARVTPAHKYRIVRALQAEGEVVAMTGDGINDGPALRAADVGIAMGARGTQLARDVADVVLLDDDFGSIVAAIEQGRTIAANAGKALRFLVATNFSEILVTLGALSIGIARPLSPVQLLWLNLLSDVFPALALAVEPAGPDVMERPPRPPTEPILPPGEMVSLAGDSAVMAAAALGARGLAAAAGAGGAAPSVLFTTLTGGQLLYALTCRSRSRPALPGLRRNPALAAAVGGSLALQVGTSVVPALRRLLGTAPIGAAGWSIALGGALLPFITREIVKAATRSSARPT